MRCPLLLGRLVSRFFDWLEQELVPLIDRFSLNVQSDVLQVAPVTARHILKLAKMGAYNTVNFFRVDQGFVAQTADVVYGRLESCPLDARQMVCLT